MCVWQFRDAYTIYTRSLSVQARYSRLCWRLFHMGIGAHQECCLLRVQSHDQNPLRNRICVDNETNASEMLTSGQWEEMFAERDTWRCVQHQTCHSSTSNKAFFKIYLHYLFFNKISNNILIFIETLRNILYIYIYIYIYMTASVV
jgi:hypothetical protein